MKRHAIVVEDRSASVDDVWLVQGTRNADEVLAVFEDSEWSGLKKLVTFSGSASVITPEVTENEDGSVCVTVPWEVVKEAGDVQVVIDGIDAENDVMVKTARLSSPMVVKASYVSKQETYDPTLTEYQAAYVKAVKASSSAELVNAELSDDGVLTVTSRDSSKKSVDVKGPKGDAGKDADVAAAEAATKAAAESAKKADAAVASIPQDWAEAVSAMMKAGSNTDDDYLKSGDDLNSISKPCTRISTGASVTSGVNHIPDGVADRFVVHTIATDKSLSRLGQILYSVDGAGMQTYTRTGASDAWNSWRSVTKELPVVADMVAVLSADVAEQVNYNRNYYDGQLSNTFIDASSGKRGSYGRATSYVSADNDIEVEGASKIEFHDMPTSAKTLFVLFYNGDTFIKFESSNVSGAKSFAIPEGTTRIAYEFDFGRDAQVTDVKPFRVLIDPEDTSRAIVAKHGSDIESIYDLVLEWAYAGALDESGTWNLITKDYYPSGSHKVLSVDGIYGLRVDKAFVNSTGPAVSYFSGEPSKDTYISSEGKGSSVNVEAIKDVLCAIPDGTTHIVLNSYTQSGSYAFSVRKLKDSDDKLIDWSLSADDVTMSSPYEGGGEFGVTFGKRGPSSLPDFKFIDIDGTRIYSNVTDWHGPFVVRAKENGDGDHPDLIYFTGGNHSYTNSGSGVATASNVSFKIYVDGVEASSGDSGKCNKIAFVWVNRVQAYNTTKADGTGREVLEERHRMTFDGFKFESYVELEALEDVYMDRYYGYQCAVSTEVYPSVTFVGGSNRKVYSYGDAPRSGNKDANAIVWLGDSHRMEMRVDRTVDLGRCAMVTDSTSGFFVSGSKGYSYLIDSKDMLAGDIYAAVGSWQFMPQF